MNRVEQLKKELDRRFAQTGCGFNPLEVDDIADELFGSGRCSLGDVRRAWEEWSIRQTLAAYFAFRADTSTLVDPSTYVDADDLIEQLADRGFRIVRATS